MIMIMITKVFIQGFKQTLKLTRSIIKEDTAVSVLITIYLESETSVYKVFLKPLCINTWDLARMRPTKKAGHLGQWQSFSHALMP